MNQKKIEQYSIMPAEKRYRAFIENVIGYEEIYLLTNEKDFYAIKQGDKVAILLWHDKELVDYYKLKHNLTDFEVFSLDFDEFLNEFLIDINNDGVILFLNPIPFAIGTLINPLILKSDIEDRLELEE